MSSSRSGTNEVISNPAVYEMNSFFKATFLKCVALNEASCSGVSDSKVLFAQNSLVSSL